MKKIIKKIIKKFLGLNKFDDYVDIGYYWSDSFKDSIFKCDINQNLKRLKANLPEDSKKVIDLVLERLIFLIPRKNQKILIHKNTLFSEYELSLQEKILREKTYEKYPFKYHYFTSETYFFHNGIKFLNKNNIDNFITNNVILDVGAYNGDSAYIFSLYNPKQIISIEADKNNFLALSENIKKFNLKNVLPLNKMIDSINSIDNIIKDLWGGGSQKIGFIKMDIEGSEMMALNGATNTIINHKPILAISIYHNVEQFFGAKIFLENLNLGYNFRIIKLSIFHPSDEIYLLAIPNGD
ncbi:FkbM family methyltransferase [Helicobacter sp. MIT 99-5507]|uniref:FkbM family methyltransferase n=1 Tax=Helicobacter sp. MIT 99-5507 TaxID=152489 RepID=UPI000E1EB51E|nr:FkbM family methyltransferase [Helicobacter sp. MIT 99-5507]RDU58623.1 hypothetical protein CQA42_02245 [Helicobacter sp. MIT 99-5507]